MSAAEAAVFALRQEEEGRGGGEKGKEKRWLLLGREKRVTPRLR